MNDKMGWVMVGILGLVRSQIEWVGRRSQTQLENSNHLAAKSEAHTGANAARHASIVYTLLHHN